MEVIVSRLHHTKYHSIYNIQHSNYHSDVCFRNNTFKKTNVYYTYVYSRLNFLVSKLTSV